MLNRVILVGKVEEVHKNKISISIKYRDDMQVIPVTLDDNLMKNTKDYIKKGGTIGIKAHLEHIDKDDVLKKVVVIAEKITFISENNINS